MRTREAALRISARLEAVLAARSREQGVRVIRNPPRRNPPRYRYLGTNDDVGSCSCCGKQNLKRVVWLAELDADGNEVGEPGHYGTTCAGHLLRGTCGRKPTVAQARDLIDEAKDRTMLDAADAARQLALPSGAVASINKYGVPIVTLDDAVGGRRITSNRWDSAGRPDHVYGDLAGDVARVQSLWYDLRAVEIARGWGMHDASIHALAGARQRQRKRNPTDDEIDQWMADYDAWERERDARRVQFSEETRSAFEQYGIVTQHAWSDDSEWILALTRSARPGAVYQVTDFRGAEPMGHREFDDLEGAIEDLWRQAPPSVKRLRPSPNPSARTRTFARRVGSL